GSAQQSYRSLVWLGRSANIASKLTDHANKPEVAFDLTKLKVGYDYLGNGMLTYVDEWPHEFVQQFVRTSNPALTSHKNPAYRSFYTVNERSVRSEETPPILMTKKVFDGFRSSRPDAVEFQNGWFKQ